MHWIEGAVRIIEAIVWPGFLIAVVVYLRNDVFRFLKGKKIGFKNQTMEIVIEEAVNQIALNKTQREELEYLSAHDIWALEAFTKQDQKFVDMNLALKVAAKSFVEMGLVEIKDGKAKLSEKGNQLLAIANTVSSKIAM